MEDAGTTKMKKMSDRKMERWNGPAKAVEMRQWSMETSPVRKKKNAGTNNEGERPKSRVSSSSSIP